jgi:hypothetical protein
MDKSIVTRVKALWYVMAPIKTSSGKPQYSPRQIMTHTRARHVMAHTKAGHGTHKGRSWRVTNLGL